MGLSGSLQIGRSGLIASQTAIELTGQNLANIATPGYHRQTIGLTSAGSHEIQRDIFIGRGVQVQQIVRHIHESLESRLRTSIADQSGALERQQLLSQIESLENELSDNDLSSHLSAFFGAWNELANSPQDNSVRTLVLQQARTLGGFIRGLREDLVQLRQQVDAAIDSIASTVNDLLEKIEAVNGQLVLSEAGGGQANGLRDQRDALLAELSQYVEVSAVEQNSGAVDVFVGSLPIVLNGKSRGVELRRQALGDRLEIDLVIQDDQSVLQATSGRLGALAEARDADLVAAIDTLDRFAHELIFQVNRIHSQGQGLRGFDSVTAAVRVDDPAAVLTSAAAGLEFTPRHGSFQVHLTQKSTGQRTTSVINVDLDGINPSADTTLQSLATDLDAAANLSASISPDGRLTIQADSADFEITFSDDSSGVLAALGINTFFVGSDARDIDVNSVVDRSPALVAAAQGHVPGDNRTALALAGLRDESVPGLDGLSLTEFWDRHVGDYAARAAQAELEQEATTVVRENLQAQQQSVSGVNTDEETINLLAFQRAYQGSARFLVVVDELLQTLLSLV